MTDAISRSAALEFLDSVRTLKLNNQQIYSAALIDELSKGVEKLPALDVAPVVHARWIVIRMAGERVAIQCSACKNYDNPSKVRGNYCWNCGAKMDGEENAAD